MGGEGKADSFFSAFYSFFYFCAVQKFALFSLKRGTISKGGDEIDVAASKRGRMFFRNEVLFGGGGEK